MKKNITPLNSPKFSDQQLEALFGNVLQDDVAHPDALLPAHVTLDYAQEDLIACYRLCWQLLDRGVDIRSFRRLIARIALQQHATERDRPLFKNARAKFKHFRFACANLDKRHRYPWSLNFVTSLMGHMQDAFKNGQKLRTTGWGIVLWLSMQKLPYLIVRRQMADFLPATPSDVRAYFQSENRRIARALKGDQVTGKEFHEIRKIISRRIAFNDTLRTVSPSEHNDRISLYLATINGLMGDMHDRLVEMKVQKTQNYYQDRFPLPAEIALRLRIFVTQTDKA